MYKAHLLFAVLTVTLKYSSPVGMDENDVRAPFGPRMCVEWCHSLRNCHSPIFVMRDLSCHVGEYSDRLLNSAGTYKLSVNKTFRGDCSRQVKTISTRRSRFVTVPDGTQSNVKTSIILLKGGWLNVYEQSIHSRSTMPPGKLFLLIAGGGTPGIVYGIITDHQTYNISYYNVSNPTAETPVLGHDKLGSRPEMAVDDGAGLVFVVTSVSNKCKLSVFKNKEILRTFLLYMQLKGNVALSRVHRKLYIPHHYDSLTFVGQVSYDGVVEQKLLMSRSERMRIAYDERDDVVYVMVTDSGIKYVYTLNFRDGSSHKEMAIPSTFQPQIILISCNTLVLIGRTKGLMYDRNLESEITEIDGCDATSGVIFEHA